MKQSLGVPLKAHAVIFMPYFQILGNFLLMVQAWNLPCKKNSQMMHSVVPAPQTQAPLCMKGPLELPGKQLAGQQGPCPESLPEVRCP